MNTITYCMNIHPGEDLESVRKSIEDVAIPLHHIIDANNSFPLGLRLGNLASRLLRVPEELQRFVGLLQRNHLTTIGINGFPYGAFHNSNVKTHVYEPDWSDPNRISYTRDLFYALSKLPAEFNGSDQHLSVTTVPLGYNRGQNIDEYLENICTFAIFLRKLEGFTGRRMRLALEPEPDCLLESAQDTVDFFEKLWQHPAWNVQCKDYIGVCFDTCHFAISYEEPLLALRHLVQAGIPIARIQVSAALETNQSTEAEDLMPFLDDTYLHQTRRREDDATLTCFHDLTPETINEIAHRRGRIHYHIPLSWDGTPHLGSTRHTLTPAFWRYVRSGGWPLEVETYTFTVFPELLRKQTVSEIILSDISWTRDQLRKA